MIVAFQKSRLVGDKGGTKPTIKYIADADKIGSVFTNITGAECDPDQAARILQIDGERGRSKRLLEHAVISFDPGDTISPEISKKAVSGLLKTVGADGHGFYAVEHHDTAHRHIHVAFCPKNPETAKTNRIGKNPVSALNEWQRQFERDHNLRTPQPKSTMTKGERWQKYSAKARAERRRTATSDGAGMPGKEPGVPAERRIKGSSPYGDRATPSAVAVGPISRRPDPIPVGPTPERKRYSIPSVTALAAELLPAEFYGRKIADIPAGIWAEAIENAAARIAEKHRIAQEEEENRRKIIEEQEHDRRRGHDR